MLPKICIDKDSRISTYYVYRDNDKNKLTDNIASYKCRQPDIIVNSDEIYKDTIDIVDSTYMDQYGITVNTSSILIEKSKVNYELVNEEGLIFFKFNTVPKNHTIRLFYRIIGKDLEGNLTSLSDRKHLWFLPTQEFITNEILLDEEIIASNLDYTLNHAVSLKSYDFLKDEIKTPNETLIKYNLKYINDNSINFEIKNIWKDESYSKRTVKKITVRSRYFHSVVTNDELLLEINIPIDKLTILRKEFNEEEEHINYEDTEAHKKVLIRTKGVYDDFKNEIDFIGDGIHEKDIYLVSDNLNSDKFRLCDTNILRNKSYIYTVYLHDSIGNISKPYTTIINT